MFHAAMLNCREDEYLGKKQQQQQKKRKHAVTLTKLIVKKRHIKELRAICSLHYYLEQVGDRITN